MQSYRQINWGPTWTLAVEVHFYILLTLLLAFLSRTNRPDWLSPLPWVLATVILVSLFFRLWDFSNPSVYQLRAIQATHRHLDVLAAGVLLRYLCNYHLPALDVFRRGWPLWLGVSLLLIYPSSLLYWPHPFYLAALMPTFNWMGFFVILFLATQLPFPQSIPVKRLVAPFDYIGKHSYGIYLWHMPVQVWIIDRFINKPDWAHILCFFVLSIGVGCFFSEALEIPMLHLRNRLFPSKAKKDSGDEQARGPYLGPLPSAAQDSELPP